jgi:predicted short-subunit dehydrogenase-like oxidoreductase (DUF2520 family)
MTQSARDTPTTTAAPTARPAAQPALAGAGTLALLGAGRVGRSLAAAAADAGLGPRLARRADAVEVASAAEVVLLCVPDEAIGEAVELLASSGVRPQLAGHTSGATPLSALAPLAAAGAETFSLHPLQTIPDGATDLSDCPAAISGSGEAALAYARELARRLGMRPFEVPEEHRATYHAAASIASNFLVTLEHSASELMRAAGVEHARELLAPLVLRTAENWARHGAAALTGPIARGDETTVAGHRQALDRNAPELLDLYEALAERTRALARPDSGAEDRQ